MQEGDYVVSKTHTDEVCGLILCMDKTEALVRWSLKSNLYRHYHYGWRKLGDLKRLSEAETTLRLLTLGD